MTDPAPCCFASEPSRWTILVHGGAGDLAGDRVNDHAIGCAAAVHFDG